MASQNPYFNNHVPSSQDQQASSAFYSTDPYARGNGASIGRQDGTHMNGAWPAFPNNHMNVAPPATQSFWSEAQGSQPSQQQAALPQQPQYSSSFGNNAQYAHDARFQTYGQPSFQSPSLAPKNSVASYDRTTGQESTSTQLKKASSGPAPPTQAPPIASPNTNSAAPSLGANQHGFIQLPKGSADGQFMIINGDNIKPISVTQQMKPFLQVARAPIEIPITRATIPAFYPRKSRNEIKALLKQNPNLRAQVSKKISKKSGVSKSDKARVKSETSSTLDGKARLSRSSSESSSDESAYESSEEEPEEPSPLPAKRPETSTGATEYDTIQALWRPRTRVLGGEEIRTGLKAFSEVVSTVRERFKTDMAAAKAAEEARNMSELPMLKERVAKQREMLEVAMRAANKHGHPDILTHCGEHLAMMNGLALSLQDRVKDADYNGSLSKAILEFLTRCTGLTDANMEKTKISKILPRFAARGEAEVKALAKRVQENAVAATKKKKETAKASSSLVKGPLESKAANGEAAPKSGGAVAGVKRSLGGEGPNGSPAKKPSSGNLSSSSARPASDSPVPAPKPKVTTAAPTSTSFFSALKSASKRSATSVPVKDAAPKTASAVSSSTTTSAPAEPKKPVPPPSARPAPSLGGFAATLAGVKKAQEPERPATKAREKSPPESKEQKAKRLRKEQRRKLRVTWKPESDLVQVRLFHHDPEEELGHDASQIRDVADLNSEGRMFKLKAQMDDVMDIDSSDDEDDEAAQARFAADYPQLSLVDFSAIDQEEREQRLFAPYGGGMQQPESSERLAQEQREGTVLLAIYSSKDDIPPTPAEPLEDDSAGNVENPKSFGPIPEDVDKRIEAAKAAAATPAQTVTSPDFLANLLGTLNQSHVQHTAPAQPSQSQFDWVLNQFSNPSQAAPLPGPPPPSSAPAPDISSILSAIGHQAQPTQPTAAAPPPVPAAPDLAALLNVLNQQPAQQQATPTPPPPPQPAVVSQPHPPPSAPSQPANWSIPAAPAVPQFGGALPYENEERKRMREQQRDDEDHQQQQQSTSGSSKRQRVGKKGRGGKGSANHEPPKFVVQCRYWKEGRCQKGSECTFLHE